jgi:3-deoxy-7-phosphoheptulonate synthase
VAQRVMVDASHGNSERDHQRQADVSRDIASQIASGERGIVGVMLESFLLAGRQELKKDIELEFGKSITDACMSWDESAQVLRDLAAAVRERRGAQTPTGRVASTSR